MMQADTEIASACFLTVCEDNATTPGTELRRAVLVGPMSRGGHTGPKVISALFVKYDMALLRLHCASTEFLAVCGALRRFIAPQYQRVDWK